jgi:hypothetical protein
VQRNIRLRSKICAMICWEEELENGGLPVWPYTNDEASWLAPRADTPRTKRGSANDNDPPAQPPRPTPAEKRAPTRKPGDET